ncbi:MAG TPA: DegT/DnrJ/EryC1/StrS family aminotransferase, partial [Candidatus Peribacteria bacterium]|nr:DegT/DnrJ/EryC1/StrS family aminotransferase [Candidatus Peribacteria bacterium]
GEEILIQSYTCVVLPNAIHAAGGVPVYADIERDTLNLDLADVEKRITPRTRAIICQHTFGIPADAAALRKICDTHGMYLIEDCAHILPDSPSMEIGKWGDFLLLSFGRDKAVSGVGGGAMLSRKPEISAKLKQEQARATNLPWLTVSLLLDYPIWYPVLRPFYGMGLGKAALWALGKLRMLVPILSAEEKKGNMPTALEKMPDGCAYLTLKQLARLKGINDHRRALTRFYFDCAKKWNWPMLGGVSAHLALQKFPLFVKNANGIRAQLKQHNIHLDDGWTGCVVCPETVDLPATSYEPGSDPEAEAACEMILSLPTHPTMSLKQAKTLAELLNPLLR